MTGGGLAVIGAGGQLGRALLEAADAAGQPAAGYDRSRLDVTDNAAVLACLAAHAGDIVINAAAFTDVDGAEDAFDAAHAVNVDGADAVAQACAAHGARLIHLSTDYVFSGEGDRPWRPDDPTGPVNAYGRTKLAGEKAVLSRLEDAVVVRTSAVYAAWGRNFVRTMLRLGRERPRLQVVSDQILGPTSAHDLARALVGIAPAVRDGVSGVFHFCGTPETSWLGFAQAVFQVAKLPRPPVVEAIGSKDWPAKAKRPAYSMLDPAAFETAFDIHPLPWHEALTQVVRRLEETEC